MPKVGWSMKDERDVCFGKPKDLDVSPGLLIPMNWEGELKLKGHTEEFLK